MCSYDIWSAVFARGMTLTIVEWSRKMKKKILVVSQDLKHNPKVEKCFWKYSKPELFYEWDIYYW